MEIPQPLCEEEFFLLVPNQNLSYCNLCPLPLALSQSAGVSVQDLRHELPMTARVTPLD